MHICEGICDLGIYITVMSPYP